MNVKKAFITVILISPFIGFTQSVAFKNDMKKNISIFESSKKSTDFLKAATAFETITKTETKEWLAYYYVGLCYVLVAFDKPKQEIDTWCDKADRYTHKADSLSKDNSEIFVLKSMIAAARINVNKLNRGQKYGPIASKYANEAIKLDGSNPRAHFVKARAILNTPKAFGGGSIKAKAEFESALEKCKNFKPVSAISPNWGKSEIEKELKKLN